MRNDELFALETHKSAEGDETGHRNRPGDV